MSQRLSENATTQRLFTLMQPMVRWLLRSPRFSRKRHDFCYRKTIPQPDDENVIMSDADFQIVRTNATAGRVFYVWGPSGSSLTNYREFNRSDLESANVKPSPTTSINPNNWGQDPNGNRVHFWAETTGATLSGGDYSILNWRYPRLFGTIRLRSNFQS